MARILIANFDDAVTSELVRQFRLRGHDTDGQPSAEAVSEGSSDFDEYDLIVFDASRASTFVENIVGKLTNTMASEAPRQALLCVSNIYRGPEWEFNLTSKGARVVYVESSAGRL